MAFTFFEVTEITGGTIIIHDSAAAYGVPYSTTGRIHIVCNTIADESPQIARKNGTCCTPAIIKIVPGVNPRQQKRRFR
jgi:hypothetical protein